MSTPTVVQARPIRMTRIGWASAAVVFVAFLVTAIAMPHANAGAHFGVKDQVATALIGLILAGLLIMPTRPRLYADADGVRLRAFLGGWRVVPWDVVVAVEFPANVRFARLRLPGEEVLAIYAVQRMDGGYAVEAMRALRALFATSHPAS
ncbi:MAG TPA: PH domain-containing protein [Jatrophihabitantaceae bacterium]|nr:PH domain-containing protein [Jatrophihabitantaceae bacterium]